MRIRLFISNTISSASTKKVNVSFTYTLIDYVEVVFIYTRINLIHKTEMIFLFLNKQRREIFIATNFDVILLLHCINVIISNLNS